MTFFTGFIRDSFIALYRRPCEGHSEPKSRNKLFFRISKILAEGVRESNQRYQKTSLVPKDIPNRWYDPRRDITYEKKYYGKGISVICGQVRGIVRDLIGFNGLGL